MDQHNFTSAENHQMYSIQPQFGSASALPSQHGLHTDSGFDSPDLSKLSNSVPAKSALTPALHYIYQEHVNINLHNQFSHAPVSGLISNTSWMYPSVPSDGYAHNAFNNSTNNAHCQFLVPQDSVVLDISYGSTQPVANISGVQHVLPPQQQVPLPAMPCTSHTLATPQLVAPLAYASLPAH